MTSNLIALNPEDKYELFLADYIGMFLLLAPLVGLFLFFGVNCSPCAFFCFFLSVFVFCAVFPLFCWFCVLPHGATRAKRKLQAHATGDGRYRLFEAEAPSAGILALQRGMSSPKSETRRCVDLQRSKVVPGPGNLKNLAL